MIFSSRRFLQKTNERILLYYYETSGRLVFVFRFLEEIKDTKKTFRNCLTFRKAKYGKTKITGSCAQTKTAEMSAKLQLTFVDKYSFTILRSDVIKYRYVYLSYLLLIEAVEKIQT